jgi:hypothetical protein
MSLPRPDNKHDAVVCYHLANKVCRSPEEGNRRVEVDEREVVARRGDVGDV